MAKVAYRGCKVNISSLDSTDQEYTLSRFKYTFGDEATTRLKSKVHEHLFSKLMTMSEEDIKNLFLSNTELPVLVLRHHHGTGWILWIDRETYLSLPKKEQHEAFNHWRRVARAHGWRTTKTGYEPSDGPRSVATLITV